MSEDKKEICDCFNSDELAVIFNALGEVPLKLNSKEVGFFSQLRDKVAKLHEQKMKQQNDNSQK